VPTTRLADINVDGMTRRQLTKLISRWARAINEESKRHVHGERVPPGAALLVNWLDRTAELLRRKSEPLGDTRSRIREFLARLESLEGVPLEVDLG